MNKNRVRWERAQRAIGAAYPTEVLRGDEPTEDLASDLLADLLHLLYADAHATEDGERLAVAEAAHARSWRNFIAELYEASKAGASAGAPAGQTGGEGEPRVCGGTGDHEGQGIATCDECDPREDLVGRDLAPLMVERVTPKRWERDDDGETVHGIPADTTTELLRMAGLERNEGRYGGRFWDRGEALRDALILLAGVGQGMGLRTYTDLRDFLDRYTDERGEIQGDPSVIAGEAVASGLVARDANHDAQIEPEPLSLDTMGEDELRVLAKSMLPAALNAGWAP